MTKSTPQQIRRSIGVLLIVFVALLVTYSSAHTSPARALSSHPPNQPIRITCPHDSTYTLRGHHPRKFQIVNDLTAPCTRIKVHNLGPAPIIYSHKSIHITIEPHSTYEEIIVNPTKLDLVRFDQDLNAAAVISNFQLEID